MTQSQKEQYQYRTAVASFAAAVCFGAAGLALNAGHEPASGVLLLISQFLLLTASIFGIDYKWNQSKSTNHETDDKRHPKDNN